MAIGRLRNMKKPILIFVAAAGAPWASALTLTLENPIVTATAPSTGVATFALRGTVALSPGETFSGGGGANAFDGMGHSVSITQNFAPISVALNSARTFTGDLGFIEVESTDPTGFYNVDATGFQGPYIAFEAITPQNTLVTSYATYGVQVQAVPEPASLAALGLGTLGLLRRRSRSAKTRNG